MGRGHLQVLQRGVGRELVVVVVEGAVGPGVVGAVHRRLAVAVAVAVEALRTQVLQVDVQQPAAAADPVVLGGAVAGRGVRREHVLGGGRDLVHVGGRRLVRAAGRPVHAHGGEAGGASRRRPRQQPVGAGQVVRGQVVAVAAQLTQRQRGVAVALAGEHRPGLGQGPRRGRRAVRIGLRGHDAQQRGSDRGRRGQDEDTTQTHPPTQPRPRVDPAIVPGAATAGCGRRTRPAGRRRRRTRRRWARRRRCGRPATTWPGGGRRRGRRR